MKFTPVSERRQKVYDVPVRWGGPTSPVVIARARLMQEVESKYPVCECSVCGRLVSHYYSFTECDDYGAEVIVGPGCFKKCEEVEE